MGSPEDDRADIVRRALVELLPRLRAFTRSLAGSADEGDDLAQATCLRAMERADQADLSRSLSGWTFRIAHNLHVDRLRAGQVRGRGFEVLDPDTVVGGDAEQEAEANLMLASVRRAVARLPDDQRIVLLMVTAQGMSYSDVARSLEIPIGTVMSRLHRARQTLARLLNLSVEQPAGPVRREGSVS